MTFIDYAAIVGCSTIAGAGVLTLRFIGNQILTEVRRRHR